MHAAPVPAAAPPGAVLVIPKQRLLFATRSSHSQVCDAVVPISDTSVCFVGPSGVCMLDSVTRKAFLVIDGQHVYSVTAVVLPEARGALVACCGSDGMKVAYVGRDNGRLRVMATCGDPEPPSMNNFVRLTHTHGVTVLTRCFNSNRGVQQFVVTYDASRGITLTLARSIAQRDWPNAALPCPEHGLMFVVNDGQLSSACPLDEVGLVVTGADAVILDHLFAGARAGRSSGQPQYVGVSRNGTVAFAVERENGLLVLPSLASASDAKAIDNLPYCGGVAKGVAISADGELVCLVTRNCAYVIFLADPEQYPMQKLEGFQHINGVAFCGNTLFVTDAAAVHVLERSSVASLRHLCMERIRALGLDTSALPAELQGESPITPAAIQFEGVVLGENPECNDSDDSSVEEAPRRFLRKRMFVRAPQVERHDEE